MTKVAFWFLVSFQAVLDKVKATLGGVVTVTQAVSEALAVLLELAVPVLQTLPAKFEPCDITYRYVAKILPPTSNAPKIKLPPLAILPAKLRLIWKLPKLVRIFAGLMLSAKITFWV